MGDRVVGYARVSTNRQEAEGLSLEAQEARLRAAGATEVIRDVLSGAKDHRPGYRELLRLVRERQIDGVVITKLDRLGRSLSSRAEVFALFSEPGAPWLKALDDQLDLTTASGRMLADMLGAIATGERERIRERIKDGLAERERRGLLVGQCPWGLRLTRTGAGVEIDPDAAPQVHAVLEILRAERGMGTAARRIAAEVGMNQKKSRSVWRTWLLSPQLSGGIPKGCKDQLKRVYDSVTPGAFESYLTPSEHEQLIAKFAGGEARGPRSSFSYPTRQRVFCGGCGHALQRRNGRDGRPQWLHCIDTHCELKGRTITIAKVLPVLAGASFYFSNHRLETAIHAKQAARKARQPSARELALQATLAALRALPQDVVGDSVVKAERELATLQGQELLQQGIDAVNLNEAVRLLQVVAASSLEEPTQAELDTLGQLFRVAAVSVTTGEGYEVKCGRRRIVLDTAQANGCEPVQVTQLPAFGQTGGAFDWRDLEAGLQALG